VVWEGSPAQTEGATDPRVLLILFPGSLSGRVVAHDGNIQSSSARVIFSRLQITFTISNKPRTEKVLVKIDPRTALSIRIKEQQHLLGSHFLHPPIRALCDASIFIKIISKRPPDYKSQEPPLLSFHNLTKLLFTNIFCSMFDGLTPQF
jgi:hypothetical protein